MDKRNELIHRLLDGDLDEQERDRIRRQIEADPRLAKELRRMNKVTELLARAETLSPGAGFTASVMGLLPDRPKACGARLMSFFFGERVLRWNMATAAMAAALIIGALIAVRFVGEPEARRKAGADVLVTFRLYAPQARQVSLAGEFNRWQPDATTLAPDGNGFWSAQVTLAPGAYTYMFVLDGATWVTDPEAELYRDDGFGYRNAVLRVDNL